MFRRLFWLSAVAGVGYLIWRWVREQNDVPAGPHTSGQLYSPPAAPAAPAPPSVAPAAPPTASPPTPRRIPTRVHRGAPPAASATSEPPAAPAEAAPTDLADLVSPAAEAPADLAELVGDAVAGEGGVDLVGPAADDLATLVGATPPASDDLAELVGAAVSGEGEVDLAPLVSPEAAADTPALGGPLTNLNTADEEALIALPGIGPALAKRIIAYREANGPFASIEALEIIQGIGPRNIEEFRHLVTI